VRHKRKKREASNKRAKQKEAEKKMRVGIAADHGGFGLKQELIVQLRAAGREVVDFGAHVADQLDDYPDFVIPLAEAVAAGTVERGIAICGSGVGASVCANKVTGIRAALINDGFSARQGVEDDHMNIICLGGRTVGSSVAWDFVTTFLAARFSRAKRHLRRLDKVASLEARDRSATPAARRLGSPGRRAA
jgi:ribose 5-phosphate isomerase B